MTIHHTRTYKQTHIYLLIARFNPFKTPNSKDSPEDSSEIKKNIGVRTLQTQRNRKKNKPLKEKEYER